MSVLIAFLSLAVEAKLGYPDRLYRAIGHPVTWIGCLISFIDRRLNRATDSDGKRRLCGVAALIAIVAVPAAIAYGLERLLLLNPLGIFVAIALGTTLLAQKSLADHVEAVAKALDTGGLAAGREAVSKIVGRDPENLDRAAVSRAAIESLAENFSDGVVAPAFWMAVGGLAGGAAYKAANTADSMIGHRTTRHEAFGWAAARFDDLINLPASRLTALLIVAAAAILPGMDANAAWRAVWRDAKKHRSPNAGWPEAAMAGALGIALAGPRSYGGVTGDYAFMGEGGRREVTAADIRRALRLFWMADVLLMVTLAVVGIALLA
ncbi:adenosylcobinamide-phosphate synthase CbiB [Mesorhizobium sp. KR9-304]|uniref:adenosylcobinamide-phosphate synthase CbiB n=1 Tax=Mesorhizobium sp. KR9-304 TaxID=3156614 RepID=UPI0032B50FA6